MMILHEPIAPHPLPTDHPKSIVKGEVVEVLPMEN